MKTKELISFSLTRPLWFSIKMAIVSLFSLETVKK